jgi:hypothetical protein
VQALLATHRPSPVHPVHAAHHLVHAHDHAHASAEGADSQGVEAPGHRHHHAAHARFLPCPDGLDREGLGVWATAQRSDGLQRLKGVLQSADGRLFMAQWALGDEAVALVEFEGPVPKLGLTCIA